MSKPAQNAWAHRPKIEGVSPVYSVASTEHTETVASKPLSPKTTEPTIISEDIEYLIDIGANLAHKKFSSDFGEVISRCLDPSNNVRKIIITGTSLASTRRAIELAKTLPEILYATAGVHPHDAKTWTPQVAAEIRNLVKRNPGVVVAIGECGLDFDRNFSTPEAQVQAFRAQLELACEMELPVFLHERAAFKEFYEILREFRPRLSGGVVHCFTGTGVELDAYLRLDMHIGITGWICDDRRGKDLRKLVSRIPMERLMIET